MLGFFERRLLIASLFVVVCLIIPYFRSTNESIFKEKSFEKRGHIWQIPREIPHELGYLIRVFEQGGELKVNKSLDMRTINHINSEIFAYYRNTASPQFQPTLHDLDELDKFEYYRHKKSEIREQIEIKKKILNKNEYEIFKKEKIDEINKERIDKYEFPSITTLDENWVTSIGCLRVVNLTRTNSKFKKLVKTESGFELSGFFYYPPGGFREMHTNRYNTISWRLYYVKTLNESESSFNYINPDNKEKFELIKVPDKNNYFNLFKVKENQNLWHSVFSGETHRFSIGFRISEEYATSLLSRL